MQCRSRSYSSDVDSETSDEDSDEQENSGPLEDKRSILIVSKKASAALAAEP